MVKCSNLSRILKQLKEKMKMVNSEVTKLYRELSQQGNAARQKLNYISKSAGKVNEDLLYKILQDNAKTEYGKKYNFTNISDIESFKKFVPVSTYADYEPYIKRMVDGDEENLITAYPINRYFLSSGTKGKPKLIPYTDNAKVIADTYLSSSYPISLFYEFLGDAWEKEKFLMLIEPCNKTVGNNKICSSVSTLLFTYYETSGQHKMVVSPEAAYWGNPEINTWYLHARYALMEKDMSGIISPYVTYIIELFNYIKRNWSLLIDDIATGKINSSISIPKKLREELENELVPDIERAKELRSIFMNHEADFVKHTWKNINFVVTIGSGLFADKTKQLKSYLSESTSYYFVGYVSSECTFSIPVGFNSFDSILLPEAGFYEFLPLDENDYSKTLTISQLRPGEQYEVIVTNLSGFYRYKMKDIIQVSNMYNSCPLISFSRRMNNDIDLFGEKTTEIMLQNAVNNVSKSLDMPVVGFSACSDISSHVMKYVFFIEFLDNETLDLVDKFAEELNTALGKENYVYDILVSSEKISPLIIKVLKKDTYEQYREKLVSEGMVASQIKPLFIIDSLEKKKFFTDRVNIFFEKDKVLSIN